MIKIETMFPNRLIVCGLDEGNVVLFIENLLKHAWMEHDIPGGMRVVKQGKKLSLDMLPKDFDADKIAKKTSEKGVLMLERIGAVNMFLNMWVNRTGGANPQIKVDIDRFSYEKDGNNLVRVVNDALSTLE